MHAGITKATGVKSDTLTIAFSRQNCYANLRQHYVYQYIACLVNDQEGMRLLLCTRLLFKYNSSSELLLPKGQMGEAWKPSKRHCSFGNQGPLHIKLAFQGLIPKLWALKLLKSTG